MDPPMNSCFNMGVPPNMDIFNPASCNLSDPAAESALREFLFNDNNINEAVAAAQNNGLADLNDIPDELRGVLDEPLSRDWVWMPSFSRHTY